MIVFSHDPKFDEPAIIAALRQRRRLHRRARQPAHRAWTAPRASRPPASSEDALARVHSPCGLDIGAATPEEVAISIMAEVIAARSGRVGEPLISAQGSIRPR